LVSAAAPTLPVNQSSWQLQRIDGHESKILCIQAARERSSSDVPPSSLLHITSDLDEAVHDGRRDAMGGHLFLAFALVRALTGGSVARRNCRCLR
jgi:hypothetical protein